MKCREDRENMKMKNNNKALLTTRRSDKIKTKSKNKNENNDNDNNSNNT